MDEDGEERVFAVVIVRRVMEASGSFRDEVATEDGQGEALDFATSMSMLAIAPHILYNQE